MTPDVALIVVTWLGGIPVVTAVNNPVLAIVPALGLEVAHVTLDVMSCVVPPASVATALNCWVLP